MNAHLFAVLTQHATWFESQLGETRLDWYVFLFCIPLKFIIRGGG
jgi:hypothetical protein